MPLFLFIFDFITYIHSFNHMHSSVAIRWSLSPYPHRLCAQGGKLPFGAEPRIEPGPALQHTVEYLLSIINGLIFSLFTCLHSIFFSYFFLNLFLTICYCTSCCNEGFFHHPLQKRIHRILLQFPWTWEKYYGCFPWKKDEKEPPTKVVFFLLFYLSS